MSSESSGLVFLLLGGGPLFCRAAMILRNGIHDLIVCHGGPAVSAPAGSPLLRQPMGTSQPDGKPTIAGLAFQTEPGSATQGPAFPYQKQSY